MSSATKYELPSNHSKTLVVQGGVMLHSSSRTWRLVLLALAAQPCTVPLQVKYVCSSQVTKALCPYTQTTFKAKPSPVHSSTHHTHTLLLLSHAHNAYQSGMSVLRSKVQRCVSGPRGSVGVSVSHEQYKGSLVLTTKRSNVQWTHAWTGGWSHGWRGEVRKR